MKRLSFAVPAERAEEARAAILELFPEGFEERDLPGAVEIAAYTDDAREHGLRAACRALGLSVDARPVEEGWEHRWRTFHRGVRVGALWVGPPWEEPAAGTVAVVIEPGGAFGTGAHPTTRLCLESLTELPTCSLLDVGCGSGVLAVAAAKLGHAPVLAVDIEPEAVEATRRNANANGVQVDAVVADALYAELPAMHAAVVNLTLASVEAVTPRLRCRRLVTSGYLDGDEPRTPGYRRLRRIELDGWAADVWEGRDE